MKYWGEIPHHRAQPFSCLRAGSRGMEVDVLVEAVGRVIGVEVKSGATVASTGLQAWLPFWMWV